MNRNHPIHNDHRYCCFVVSLVIRNLSCLDFRKCYCQWCGEGLQKGAANKIDFSDLSLMAACYSLTVSCDVGKNSEMVHFYPSFNSCFRHHCLPGFACCLD
jgi:hypothetical protein